MQTPMMDWCPQCHAEVELAEYAIDMRVDCPECGLELVVDIDSSWDGTRTEVRLMIP